MSFWRNTKSLVGLSVKSVSLNTFFQTVIFLYLLDNDTSTMVLVSTGIGLAIEYWKLRRALGASLRWDGWRPSLQFADEADDLAYSQSHTRAYDDEATSHMFAVMLPIVIGQAAYTLLHSKHRSWYSWLLSSTVSYVYVFGFIGMVPQLWINYRLKSVA